MSEKHDGGYGFYHPELWSPKFIGHWCWPTKVDFDCDEEKMLSEIARYTGYSRDFIAREAVRYLYEKWFSRQSLDSGPYYRCHEPVVWMDSSELGVSEEVNLDG